ncbi:hypothetical protein GGF46_005396, partial [Coemansia sp. RSA 552]
ADIYSEIKPKHCATPRPRHPGEHESAHYDVTKAISEALMDPHMVVAGDGFLSLLLEAIESNGGNMPVISV